MASIALMGLLTGLAKGATARIEKEQEDLNFDDMMKINKSKLLAEV